MEVLKKLKTDRPQLPVIMLTGTSDLQIAVEAIKQGAYHYFTKPFDNEQMLITARHAMEKNDLLAQMEELRKKAGRSEVLSRIVGNSPAIQEVIRQIQKVAASDLTVLIQGETGSGKELAARALHEESSRRGKPFVAIDCGAIAENLLESELFGHEKGSFSGADRKKEGQLVLAQGGTVFLDEIGNLPLTLQSKMLRVLQERQVRPVGADKPVPINVRFIAATNAPLEAEAKAGRFRQDLYYRLAEFTLDLPSLRERREDIPALARKFTEEAGLELRRPVSTIEEGALELLGKHPWPGNIRELRNIIRQAVLMTPDFTLHTQQVKELLKGSSKKDAPEGAGPLEVAVPAGATLKQVAESAVEGAEKQAIRNALRATRGNKSQAAKLLKTDYKTLHVKIKKYGLPASED
jgi:DNA-binding NtrC family response regulator